MQSDPFPGNGGSGRQRRKRLRAFHRASLHQKFCGSPVMTIQRLSDLEFDAAGASKPLKICVASFFGAAKSGGVGTATSALIDHLASIGHSVTLLYTLVHKGKPLNVEEHGSGVDSW